MLVSSKHQRESAIDLPMSPSTGTSLPPPPPSHPSRLSPSPGLSSFSHTANSHWLSTLHMVMYVSMLLPPYIPPLLSPPDPKLCPYVCSQCVCLHCCSAKRFISTIFLDFIYMCEYTISVFLFLTDFTFYFFFKPSFMLSFCYLLPKGS